MELNRTATLHVPSLVDVLYAALRDAILTNQIEAGAPLREMELSSAYSVARPTVRAALERLVHDGLLRRSTNKTARVPVLDHTDISDLYFTRRIIEREVVTVHAASGKVPSSAVEALGNLRTAAAREDPVPKIVELDIAFHYSLVEALGSPRLLRLYEPLMGEMHLCMAQVQRNRLLAPSRIADEHAAILDAIASKSKRSALAEIDQHLQRARDRLLEYISEDPVVVARVKSG